MTPYQGAFLRATAGHLYVGCYGPLAGRRVWLYLPPFAEEMNLSRAIVSRQARALAECGDAVVCLDYFGTGDSEGEFGQATVDIWMDDLGIVIDWVRAQGARSLHLWGLRFGGLMATHYLGAHPDADISSLLLWKPVLDGKQLMAQFFRLKQVSESMRGGNKVNWLERVRQGETVEVAGYPVTPQLLHGIAALKVDAAQAMSCPDTQWIDVASEQVAPAAAKVASLWPAPRLTLSPSPAPSFWQSPDCYQAPELIQRTLEVTR